MSDRPTTYITTPIYYVNDVPHLGHAYTTIVADTFARHARRRDGAGNAYFVTGTDEHGQKIQRAAEAKGRTPLELADEVVARFADMWERLGITHDDFIRTTEERHQKVVQEMWRRMEAAGDIYLDSYSGWYCVGCEAYYTEKEIAPTPGPAAERFRQRGEAVPENICPVGHGVEHREEPSYFFRLGAYQDKLLALYDRHKDDPSAAPFVAPETRLNEVRSFVAAELRDISISRTSITWGVPVPGADGHVVYVWLDALSNYISALGGPGAELFERFWPANLHLIGKDILRFHAVYWPAFLMSAGLEPPVQVLSHGWWTVEGQKMSKSLANVVDPGFLIDEYGRDVVRYFVLREVPLGLDGDFSHGNLLNRINADLANDLGNLLSRTLGLVGKYTGGEVPADAGAGGMEASLHPAAEEARRAIDDAMDRGQPNQALEALWGFIGTVNRYIDSRAPWQLKKDGNEAKLHAVLRELIGAVARVGLLLDPFMPDTAAAIRQALRLDLHGDWLLDEAFGDDAALVRTGAVLEKLPGLFPRLDDEAKQAQLDKIARLTGGEAAPDGAPGKKNTNTEQKGREKDVSEQASQISIDRFFETVLKVGEVTAAEAIPKSDKLLKLTVDLAEAEPRTIVAGLAKSYTPEAITGQRVLVVANLKPAKLMGVESQGMVLAGETAEGGLTVVAPAPEVPVGTRVK